MSVWRGQHLFRKMKEQGSKYGAQGRFGIWGLPYWIYCVSWSSGTFTAVLIEV